MRADCDEFQRGTAGPSLSRTAGAAQPRASGAVTADMTRERFRRLVSDAIDSIPGRFRQHLANVAVVVEDEPSPDLLAEMEIEPPDTLFGLYQGTPLTERRWDHGNTLPDRITILPVAD